jgi:hypothetical protein
MNLNEFLEALIKSNHEAEEDCDYETLAFDAGVEYTVKKIKEFLAAETKKEKVTLPEYLDILYDLSQNRKDEDFGDRDVSWEEAGYQEALFDVQEYLDGNETYIKDILDEHKKLEN